MNPVVTQAIVDEEIKKAKAYGEMLGWVFGEVDPINQLFNVQLTSTIDSEVYIIEFKYDNYSAIPYLIDFIHPKTGILGAKTCYPKGKVDNFFHPNGAICHPCSRKAYATYGNIHAEWQLSNWRQIAGNLVELKFILDAIFNRICDKILYDGRMV